MNDEIYVGLGANLGNPKQTFKLALGLISRFAEVKDTSRLYRSEPFGFSDQPPFINAVAKISTTLEPMELLKKLQHVEGALGKEVIMKNGPRLIDLDLLLYQEEEIQNHELNLPHPGILSRDFVLLPLLDLNPNLTHPAWGPKTLKSALGGLQESYVRDEPEDWIRK